jgi:hypothetical protein
LWATSLYDYGSVKSSDFILKAEDYSRIEREKDSVLARRRTETCSIIWTNTLKKECSYSSDEKGENIRRLRL